MASTQLKLEELSHPKLQKFLREVPENEFVFKQGERGNAVFIIMEGIIGVTHKAINVNQLINLCGPGEILGEKAILSDTVYRHRFTAQARKDSTLMQVEHQNVKILLEIIPHFHQVLVQALSDRLNKANEMIAVLQLKNPIERAAHYMLLFCKNFGHTSNKGLELLISIDEIQFASNVHKDQLGDFFKELVKRNILAKVEDRYSLQSEEELLKYLITSSTKKMAA